MQPASLGERRAIAILSQQLGSAAAEAALSALQAAGLRVADEQAQELVCRWTNVLERPVPPDADTIIRTITKTLDGQSSSTTHWLDGLRGPRV